jgi:hypothetical protein
MALIIPCIQKRYEEAAVKNFKHYPRSTINIWIKYWCLVDTEACYLLDVNVYLGKCETTSIRETNIGKFLDKSYQ